MQTITMEPDPTDVSPTSRPPTMPTPIVAGTFTSIAPPGASVCRRPLRAAALLRDCSHARNTIAAAATVSVTPRKLRVTFSTVSLSPVAFRMKTPANAAGIEPTHSHRTSSHRTVRRRTWTPPPTGFITMAATRSEETAVVGLIPKKIRSTGVINAPPPMPVKPTVKPTSTEARTIPQSMCIGPLRSRGIGRRGAHFDRMADQVAAAWQGTTRPGPGASGERRGKPRRSGTR
jgi:hypothetical protein